MQGVFYGVGVGPGDGELLTLKAVRVIKECEVLAVAVTSPELTEPCYTGERSGCPEGGFLEACTAYQIALQVIPELDRKEKLYLPMPMIKEKAKLKALHDRGADIAETLLRQGKSIAFITLGDPSIYSTSLYVHERLKKRGLQTGIIPGIPSFCAAAACLNIGLVENKDELHVIPASYGVEESLRLPGTKVLMKAGKKMGQVKQVVKEKGDSVQMVENCTMAEEKIYNGVEQIPDDAGYFSLMIVKEQKR